MLGFSIPVFARNSVHTKHEMKKLRPIPTTGGNNIFTKPSSQSLFRKYFHKNH